MCAVAVLGVALLWLLRSGEKPKLASVAEAPDTNAPAVGNATQPGVGARQADANVSAPTSGERATPETVDAITPEEKEAKVRAEIEAQNVPFDFYGRVIDQDTNALSGVSLDIWARHWDVNSTAPIHLTRKTDKDGRFDIHGITGDGFDIKSVGKDGYETEPYAQLGFSAADGSLESPVIFRMWSTNIHEQLITGGKKFPITPDGRVYVIDLAKGTIAESGDGNLRVWVKRPDQITSGKRYDWSCEADVINGGLLAETDATSSMYLAPADGYTSSFNFEQKVGSGWGDSTGEKRFYVRLNNGQAYGRITIELRAYYNDKFPGMIRLSYAINPSGSRILR